MKNITRVNGTDPSVDPKLQMLENLLKDCYNENITHSHVLPDTFDGKFITFNSYFNFSETPKSYNY